MFFAPALALILTFKVWPLIRGVETSLTRPVDLFNSRFVGLSNYRLSIHDQVWIAALTNAGKLLVTLPLFVFFPLLVAAGLFHGVRGWKYFRAVFFLSWLLPPVTVGQMFGPILGFSGPVNGLLGHLGVEPINILGSPTVAPWALVGVILWSWFGLGTAIYLAGFATLPTDYLDAAKIDGAGPFATLRFIEIPHLLPTMAYWGVLCTTSMLLGLFAFIYSLTGGGPGSATTLPEFQIWHVQSSEYNPGYASALGVMLFLIAGIITLLQVRIMFRRSNTE
jgi:ABC-type sugar transport system permease subunit